METLEDGEKKKADAKAAVRFLKDRAEKASASLAKNYAAGSYSLAAQDASRLYEIMVVLGQLDLNG